MDWQVGMEVWVVPPYGRPRAAKVTKIGRKWVTLDGGRERFEAETMHLDSGGFGSPGTVWLSEDEWKDHAARNDAWRKLKNSMPWDVPKRITLDRINELIAELSK